MSKVQGCGLKALQESGIVATSSAAKMRNQECILLSGKIRCLSSEKRSRDPPKKLDFFH
jgi:hypothetical protein